MIRASIAWPRTSGTGRSVCVTSNQIRSWLDLPPDVALQRTQEQNRAEALERLAELILPALVRRKARKTTKPTRASKERRLESKRRQSRTRALRTREFD